MERVRDRAAMEARLRPTMVLAMSEAESAHQDVAALVLPADLTESARHVAGAVALIATLRLFSGDTLDFALSKVALGRDLVRRTLNTMGIERDRKTVAHALDELVERGVVERVGQLGGWFDIKAGRGKGGAYVYALNVRFRGLGDVARLTLQRAARRIDAAVRGTGLDKRIDGVGRATVLRQERVAAGAPHSLRGTLASA